MIAKVLRSGKSENVGIKGRHMWLNMVKQKSLQQVASIDSDGNFFKEFSNG